MTHLLEHQSKLKKFQIPHPDSPGSLHPHRPPLPGTQRPLPSDFSLANYPVLKHIWQFSHLHLFAYPVPSTWNALCQNCAYQNTHPP